MLKEDWEELVAQVEDHGPEAIEFHLWNTDESTSREIWVDNVQFDGYDDKIKVVLS